MKKSIRFVGLDVHKNSISVAVAEDVRGGEVRHMGTIGTTTAALDKRVARRSGDGAELRLCYGRAVRRSLPLRRPGRPLSSDGDRRGLRGGGAPRRYADAGVGAGCGSRGEEK